MTGAFFLGAIIGFAIGFTVATVIFLAVGYWRGEVHDWSPLDSCQAPPPGYDPARKLKQ